MTTSSLEPQQTATLQHDALQRPNVLGSFAIIIRLELRRLFFSRQGWLYLSAFVFFWAMMLKGVIFNVSNFFVNQGISTDNWSTTVFSTYFHIGLYLFPLLSIFIAANQTGSDRERGTLRFLVLRCSRDVIFFGRFLAQVVIHYILLSLTLFTTLAVGIYRDGFALDALTNALLMGLNLALVLLPFIAMMALLSATVKSPRQATVFAALIWSLASGIIAGMAHYFPILSPLKMLVPGMQFSVLMDLQGVAMFSLAYIPLLQTAVLLLAGRFAMQRETL